MAIVRWIGTKGKENKETRSMFISQGRKDGCAGKLALSAAIKEEAATGATSQSFT